MKMSTYSFRCQLGSRGAAQSPRSLHNVLGLLPLDNFCPLPRLTGSRILCHIRSFQMSSRARKCLSQTGYFRYEVEFVDPGPCFLKQSSATYISTWV